MFLVRNFEDWRRTARRCLRDGIPPDAVAFSSGDGAQPPLEPADSPPPAFQPVAPGMFPRVPLAFIETAKTVACHPDRHRWDLLYRILWRLTHGESELLNVEIDDDIERLHRMERVVSRNAQKARAFVTQTMNPDVSARTRSGHSDVGCDSHGAATAPGKITVMRKSASTSHSAAQFLPKHKTLKTLTAAAKHCEGCELYQRATQAVFGEGSATARMILVGEQPGDQEDLQGHPFVGPAGKLLDHALLEAGIDRSDVYVTNAVKHFNWEPRGERRLHKKPPARALAACRPWLEAEVEVLQPEVIVCLGATAAQSVIGREARITHDRGRILESSLCPQTVMTWHPSAVLRAPDATAREKMRSELIHDLKTAARALS